jgi:hypothetical protein
MPVLASRTISASVSAKTTAYSTSSSWIPVDIHQTPFNLGFGVEFSGDGELVVRVEHTFDNIFDSTVTPTAYIHDDVTAASKTNVDGNYAFGVRAIRLVSTNACGAASATIKVVQVGNI